MPVLLPFRVLGAVATALAVAASAIASAQHGTSSPWLQAACLGAFATASAMYLFAPPLHPAIAATLLAIAGAAIVVASWAQPAGVPVGMFVLAAFATMRPPLRVMLVVLVGVAVAFCAVQVPSGHESVATAAAVVAGMAFFAGVGALLLSERRQRERVAALLTELEGARAAERDASAYAARTAAAREVHDVLAHSLSGLIIQLEAARLQSQASGADPALQTSVDNALRSARAGLDEARRAVAALRGDRPQGPADIASLVEEHRLTSGAPITFEVTGEPHALSAEAGLALYRAVQEALSNVRKHARGAAADVRLAWRPDGVALTVTNRLTADVVSDARGWGLAGIEERVGALHGAVQASAENGHYVVRVELPTRRRVPSDA